MNVVNKNKRGTYRKTTENDFQISKYYAVHINILHYFS